MHYVCIEGNVISSILNYEPSVPANILVYRITDEDMAAINNGDKYFNVEEKKVLEVGQDAINAKAIEAENVLMQSALSASDWKVMRHIREKALGIPTSMTENEYIALENKRQKAAKAIVK